MDRVTMAFIARTTILVFLGESFCPRVASMGRIYRGMRSDRLTLCQFSTSLGVASNRGRCCRTAASCLTRGEIDCQPPASTRTLVGLPVEPDASKSNLVDRKLLLALTETCCNSWKRTCLRTLPSIVVVTAAGETHTRYPDCKRAMIADMTVIKTALGVIKPFRF